MRVGFAGLGLMGRPMAANLLRSGVPLCVYNRSAGPCAELHAKGAQVAALAQDLFDRCDAVILMLADDEAVDAVLDRRGGAFAGRVSDRLVINMGTHSPDFSRQLEHDIVAAGGRFVEAPVSGSRGPAETGDLFAMLAGTPEAVAQARPLIAPMCREAIEVGSVPSAMAMKLAVNLYLMASVTALAEATHLATASGLDLARFGDVIAKGPLGSSVAAAKLDKMARRDFAPQAAIRDVVKNAQLVTAAAAGEGVEAPLMRESMARFESVLEQGGGMLDMAAVLTAYETESRDD
jgi:3-hydroxyisobutyrate dehydrogenase